jgi:hypothetical protein
MGGGSLQQLLRKEKAADVELCAREWMNTPKIVE